MIVLPRQARDNIYRESTRQRTLLPFEQGNFGGERMVGDAHGKKTRLLRHFILQMIMFTKPGSGHKHRESSTQKKSAAVLQPTRLRSTWTT
jgi:hypothetical protein